MNGTERCLEVYRKYVNKGDEYDVIVNIQGDEPFIEPEHIDLVAQIVCRGGGGRRVHGDVVPNKH